MVEIGKGAVQACTVHMRRDEARRVQCSVHMADVTGRAPLSVTQLSLKRPPGRPGRVAVLSTLEHGKVLADEKTAP